VRKWACLKAFGYGYSYGMQLHKFWTENQTKDGQENILILFRECYDHLSEGYIRTCIGQGSLEKESSRLNGVMLLRSKARWFHIY